MVCGNVGGGVEVMWRGGGLYKWCGKVVYVKYIEVSGGCVGWWVGMWVGGRGGEVERWWGI